MKMQTIRHLLTLVLCSAGLSCCEGDVEGEGEVTVTLYGEDFIEVGISPAEMADGWSVTFDRFQVTVDEVRVGGVELPAAAPTDISAETGGAGHIITSAVVPAGEHSGSSFTITQVALSGSASRDGVVKTFDWRFEERTRYSACETVTVVRDGGAAIFQITVHADHFFYDSLVAAEPQVRFQALADADLDGDGAISRAELESTDIGAYDAGSDGAAEQLWAWLVAQSRTLGHVDGEGHCDAQADLN